MIFLSRHTLTGLVATLMFAATAMAKPVSGTVSDAMGPLAGVTVTLKNADTYTATVTDMDGKYTIEVPNSKAQLLFSFVGYIDKLEIVGSRKVIDVIMEEDKKILDEVVVIGYGTQTKSHLTGSISKLEGASIEKLPVSDVTQALQGMMSGLNVNNQTSEVGVAPTIRVRGTGSVSADNNPLVIVDGFPIDGGLSTLNSADIKSIEILKDAASAAIYGSRAANGVIMVTTKQGTSGKPKYTAKVYRGYKYAYKLHDMMTATEWRDLLAAEEAMGGKLVLPAARAAAYIEENVGATDWQNEGLNNGATTTKADFSISGGRKDTKFYVSASYVHDEGIMKDNKLDKFTFRSKLDTKLSNAVGFGVNLSGNYNKTTRSRNGFIDFYRTPSFMPVHHNDFTTALTGHTGFARGNHFNGISTPTKWDEATGTFVDEVTSPFSTSNNNPLSVLENTFRSQEAFQGLANAYLTIDIMKGLQFKTSNGINVRYAPQYYYANNDATKDKEPSNATFFSSLFVDILSENTLNYHCTLGNNGEHTLDALLGYTIQNTRNQRVAETATGFPTDDVHTLNAGTQFTIAGDNNGNTAGTGTFRYPDQVLQSWLGRVSYSYAGRYLASASIRLDQSSLFADGHKSAWFPSVSLGWRVSEEAFMKNQDLISNLKFRVSYGQTGNNRISYNAAFATLSNANYVTGTGQGTLVNGIADRNTTLSNPNITWEKTDEFNYGLDLGLWQNRLVFTVDAYYSVTKALLFEQPTQSFTGYSKFWNNIGKVRNTGVEIQVESRNFQTKKFKWNTNFNISFTRNKLLELGGERQMISLGERGEQYIARVGDPLIQFYGYKTCGVWNSLEEINASVHAGDDVPGGLKRVDTNDDGSINDADMVPLGNPYPDFTWGLTNTFEIGNFDVSFLIQGVCGATLLNGDIYYTETTKWNKKYTEGRWVSPENPGNGSTPYLTNGVRPWFTDYALESASYACLRNFTVGYTLPVKAVRKLNINSLRVYLTGTNLLYIWPGSYRGINPESRMTTGNYSSPLISGYQRGGFPLTSTVSAGIDITF